MKDAEEGLRFVDEATRKKLKDVGRVILVGSGKGGVGKSLVAASLAMSLAKLGCKTGILDFDIHGASLPGYLGVSPPLSSGRNGLQPKKTKGVKVMSVALLTGERPVPVKGSEKRSLLKGIFSLTDWGSLDYLVVDLPPTVGDEVLTAFELFGSKSILLLVTTPSPTAVRIVSRLRRLASEEKVPILGTAVNMAFMREGRRKTYPFGRPDQKALSRALGTRVLTLIPLEPEVNSGGLARALEGRNEFAASFKRLERLIAGL